ncbi:MAG: hypothetical protein BZ136_02085, partial [Methanosphaera sp. rholeuAM74]
MFDNRKYLLIFTLLLLLVFGLTIVSAADNSNSTVKDTVTVASPDVVTADVSNNIEVKEKTSNYEYEDTNSVSKNSLVAKHDTTNKDIKQATTTTVTNYNELINAVNSAKQSYVDVYTISLQPGDYTATANLTWRLATGSTRNLVIEGNGIELNGGNTYNFMHISAGYSLVLNNISFKQFTRDNGAVIYNYGGNVNISNANFTNNSADDGGVILNYLDANLVVTNSRFTNNSVIDAGAVLYDFGNAVISNSIFESNNGSYAGGAIYFKNGTINVINSTFIDNLAEYGGSIYAAGGNLSVSSSTFVNNITSQFGGAILNSGSNITVTDSIFTSHMGDNGNTTSNPNSTVIDSNSTVINPDAIIFPGKKSISPTSNLLGNVLGDGNDAQYDTYANAIYNFEGKFIIRGCQFMDNTATYIGGAILNNELGVLEITNSTFINNTAHNGGSIVNYLGTANIFNSTFTENTADNDAAVILNDGGNLYVSGSDFTNNHANNSGAIYNQHDGNVTIIGSEFTNNYANSAGGAIYNEANLDLSTSKFTNNTAENNFGGAIINFGSNHTLISDCEFTNNYAQSYGGAILHFNVSGVMVTGSTFTNNTATRGAAIFLYGNMSVENSQFTSNHAENGSAIYNYEDSGINITYSNFTANTGSNGSAIYNYNGMIMIMNSNFTDNNVTNNGAAIYNKDGFTMITSSNFINNNADVNGTIFNNQGSVGVEDSTFRGNTPENFVIQNNKIVLAENDNYISVNRVSIYLDDDDTPVYTGALNGYTVPKYHVIRVMVNGSSNSTFFDNTFVLDSMLYDATPNSYASLVQAVNDARALGRGTYRIGLLPGDYNATADMMLYGVNGTRIELVIDGNGLLLDGGGVHQFMRIMLGSSLSLNNITLANYHKQNASTQYENGSVICNVLSEFNAYNVNFINNSAKNGGAIYNNYGEVTISYSNFINNSATGDGGAIFSYTNSSGIDKLKISNSNFTNNLAMGHGGAISGKIDMNTGNITIISPFDPITNQSTTTDSNLFTDINNNIFVGNYPENFVKSENTLYLQENDKYIPSYATVDITVGNSTTRKNLSNNVVADYALPIGAYDLTLVVNPDTSGNSLNNTYLLNITNNDLTLTVDDVISEYSDTVAITVHTSVNVTNANVSIYVDNDAIADVVVDNITDTIGVNLDTSNYMTGTYQISVEYTDCVTGYTTTATGLLTINKLETIIEFDPITDAECYTNVTIRGELIDMYGVPVPNQFIELRVEEDVIALATDPTGLFDYTTVFNSAGEKYVVATFNGTDKYESSSNVIIFNITKADPVITLNDIPDSEYSDNIIIGGTLTRSSGEAINNATIVVTVNGLNYNAVTDASGSYAVNYTVSTVGVYDVTATFDGDSVYNSVNTTKTFNVLKKDTVITLDDIPSAEYSDKITISGTLTTNAGVAVNDATIVVTVNGVDYNAVTDASGNYAVNYTVTKVGTNNVTATFDGDSVYNSASTSATFTVDIKDTVITLDDIASVEYSDIITISGTFTRSTGVPLKNATIIVTINGVNYNTKTNANG